MAPSAIAFQTSDFIRASSASVGRAVVGAHHRAAHGVVADERREVDRRRTLAQTPAAPRRRRAPTLPQLPATIVVTPIRTKFAARGCSTRSSAWVWTSMKPGATTRRAASIDLRRLAAREPSDRGDAAVLDRDVGDAPGRPVPSITVPLMMMRS